MTKSFEDTRRIGVGVQADFIKASNKLVTAFKSQSEDTVSGHPTIPAKLVRYFAFEDNAASTTVVDSTGTANATASANTSTLSTTGIRGNCFDYDDANPDYVDCGTSVVDSSADFSVSFWLNKSDTGEDIIVGNGDNTNGFYVRIQNTNGVLKTRMGTTDTYTTTYSFSTSTWYHIVVTYNSATSELKHYVDGVLEETFTSVTGVAANDNMFIGIFSNLVAASALDGMVDELAICDAVLTDGGVTDGQTAGGEVAFLYGSGTPPVYS